MEIKTEKKNTIVVFHVSGELMGGDEIKVFQDAIYEAIRDGLVSVVVEMSGVKWMNSSGLGMLMSGLTTLRGSGGDLRLARVPDRVRRPIEITRLDRVLQIHDTVEAAMDGFASGG